MLALAAIQTAHRVPSSEDASSPKALHCLLLMQLPKPYGLSRHLGASSEPRHRAGRQINPLVFDEIQTGDDNAREAFNRIMAFAHCDYIFQRIDGVMHLSLHHIDGVPDGCQDHPELRAHYFPKYQSSLVDDAMARAEIMRMLVYTGFKGHYAMRDDQRPFPNRGGLSERDYRLIEHASFRI